MGGVGDGRRTKGGEGPPGMLRICPEAEFLCHHCLPLKRELHNSVSMVPAALCVLDAVSAAAQPGTAPT